MPPRRLVRPLLVALLALHVAATAPTPLVAARPTPLAAAQALPETNPYRDTLLRFESLPPEEREALKAWMDPASDEPARPLTESQLRTATEIAAGLRNAAAHPKTTADDWPLIADPDDPDNPAAITLLSVGSLRELARIATKVADSAPPADAIATYAAVAQLGRQQRAGATLIEQLTGVAIEGIAHGTVSRRLAEFSADDLARLSAAWAGLHPVPSNAEALRGERDQFFRPLLDRVIVPGLQALLADPAAGLEQPDAESSASFTRDLRLSALMDLGGGERRIVMENVRSQESFTLKPGAVVEGIELVSLDFPKRLAVIRHDGREAVIHLESKRIVERKDPALRLREMFQAFTLFGGLEDDETALARMLRLARRHPDGPEGYAKDLLSDYQAGIDRQLALAERAQAPRPDETPARPDDPFLAITMPTIGKVARTLNNSATSSAMLQAAIQHRLVSLGNSADPFAHPDPWASESEAKPFALAPAPDGGFLLRSAYEFAPGQPLTYKFAAPDAGFVRPPSTP